MEDLWKDITYTIRLLRRKPGFAVVAILTLTLGIGANTAIFSVIHAVLLRPLPFKNSEQLVRVTGDFNKLNLPDAGLSVPELFDLRDRSGVFEQITGLFPIDSNITWVDEPERVEALLVDVNYFSLLGANPKLGRTFQQQDYQPGITEVAVISDGLWRRRYGSDPNVIGKKFRLDNDLYSVIGVMPPDFRHPGRALRTEVDVWAPSGWVAPPFSAPVRGVRFMPGAIARLKPGVTIADAQARLDEFARELQKEYPNDYSEKAGWAPRVIGLHSDLVGDVRPSLLMLFAAVGLVLLIACANVANLLLARASSRQREIAIRRALGAGRWRLIRQLLTESVIISMFGGALGILIAFWSIDILVKLSPTNIQGMSNIGINLSVLAFTLGISIFTGLIFGLAPAIQASNPDLQETLKDTSRGVTSGSYTNRLRGLLVVSEFALSLMLLISAALLIRSFMRLQDVDPGFRTDNILTAHLWLPQPNKPDTGPYFKHTTRLAFFNEVQQRISTLPGVESASWTTRLPMEGTTPPIGITVEGQDMESAGVNTVHFSVSSPDYFKTLGIPLLKGRSFTEQEDEKAPGVVIVSQSMAEKFFPNQDPLGKRIRLGGRQSQAPWLSIIGIVRDIKTQGLDIESRPQVYRSIKQASTLSFALAIRTSADPNTLAEAVRREVRSVDPDMPVFGIKTMEEVVSAAMVQRRFAMVLFVVFAFIALALSSVGIYGVMAYMVTQRTHEIGVRMALGASPKDILKMIISHGLTLTVCGAAIGLTGAAILTRFLASLLFAISATDIATFAAMTVLLEFVALASCYIPARRAMKVDPMVALRYE
jgi:putative ABC transport system permease protein